MVHERTDAELTDALLGMKDRLLRDQPIGDGTVRCTITLPIALAEASKRMAEQGGVTHEQYLKQAALYFTLGDLQ